jgi:hypothetical protein
MNRFLDANNQSKLNQEDINHLNRLIGSNEIKAVTKSLLTKKSSGPDEVTVKFYQTFKEELATILVKLFQEIEREGTLPNAFYEASIILIKMQKEGERERERERIIDQYL